MPSYRKTFKGKNWCGIRKGNGHQYMSVAADAHAWLLVAYPLWYKYSRMTQNYGTLRLQSHIANWFSEIWVHCLCGYIYKLEKWLLKFNPAKCKILHVGHHLDIRYFTKDEEEPTDFRWSLRRILLASLQISKTKKALHGSNSKSKKNNWVDASGLHRARQRWFSTDLQNIN